MKRSMKMKKRVKSFIMAILMVLTILPTNYTTVEAEENVAIYLKLFDTDESIIDTDKLGIEVTNDDGTKKGRIKCVDVAD